MGNDILEGILRLVHTNLLILLLKYITQVTEKCIHNAGVGGSSPPVATISSKKQWPVPLLFCFRVREKLQADSDMNPPRESHAP